MVLAVVTGCLEEDERECSCGNGRPGREERGRGLYMVPLSEVCFTSIDIGLLSSW